MSVGNKQVFDSIFFLSSLSCHRLRGLGSEKLCCMMSYILCMWVAYHNATQLHKITNVHYLLTEHVYRNAIRNDTECLTGYLPYQNDKVARIYFWIIDYDHASWNRYNGNSKLACVDTSYWHWPWSPLGHIACLFCSLWCVFAPTAAGRVLTRYGHVAGHRTQTVDGLAGIASEVVASNTLDDQLVARAHDHLVLLSVSSAVE